MIANEAAYLNKEIKRLQKYGIDAIVIPENDHYMIRYRESRDVIEPYCAPTEVLGIINSIENVLNNMRVLYEQNKDSCMDNDHLVICNTTKR